MSWVPQPALARQKPQGFLVSQPRQLVSYRFNEKSVSKDKVEGFMKTFSLWPPHTCAHVHIYAHSQQDFSNSSEPQMLNLYNKESVKPKNC